MNRRIILDIHADPSFDYLKFTTDYAAGRLVDLPGCSIKEIPLNVVVDVFRAEFVEYIAKNGVTKFLERGILEEELVAPGTASSAIISLMHSFLANLGVTTELVVVDPYFFAASQDAAHLQTVSAIFSPFAGRALNATIVTLSRSDAVAAQSGMIAALRTAVPSIHISHKTSDKFHDRFWLNPTNGKGFICGTSLNGIGKRYALIDALKDDDATDVLTALRTEGLI